MTRPAIALWKKFWLLFTVIWVAVAALNVASILAFSDEVEQGKAAQPALYGVAVPAALYLLLWLWHRWVNRNKSGSDPNQEKA
jgi:membrane protein implicated in regulation of membrane protease activity